MATIFDLDKKDIRRLKRFYKNAPREFTNAAKFLLNDFAFGTRTEAIKIVNRRMTVRNERFVKSSIRFDRAKGTNLNNIHSEVGSIRRARFSGWAEQELGTRTTRSRLFSKQSRAGQWKKNTRQRVRLSSKNKFENPNEFKGNSSHHRAVVILQIYFRNRDRRPFMIHGHKRLKSGIYQLKGRKLTRQQNFKPSQVQPKRQPWLQPAQFNYLRKVDIREKWGKAIEFALKKYK